MERDNDFDTTVLTDDYGDFQDTVVDQVIAFDPSLFQGAQGEMAQQAQRPTWVSAGRPAAETQPVQQPEARPTWSQPQPTWTSAQTGAAVPPSNHSADEDTWVLGSQPTMRSSAPAAVTRPAPATVRVSPAAPVVSAAPRTQPAAWQAAPQTTPTMMAAADSKPNNKMNPVLIGVIVGLAIVGIVAIVVAVAFALAPRESSTPPSSAPAVVVAPSSSSSSASKEAAVPEPEPEPEKSAQSSYKQGTGSSQTVDGESGRASSEAEAYSQLSKLYSLAADYDSDVRSCADDFNNNYLKEEEDVRKAKAGTVSSLKSRIKSSWDEAKRVEVPMMSKNLQAYSDICELYECLWHRIDVIDQAWKVDLQYDKPKEHQDEIIAPLRAQQSNGTDRYYARFKDLYPTVNLVKP